MSMSKRERTVGIWLGAALLVLGLTACGGSDADRDPDTEMTGLLPEAPEEPGARMPTPDAPPNPDVSEHDPDPDDGTPMRIDLPPTPPPPSPPVKSGACSELFEPNDTAETACPLELGTLVVSQLQAVSDVADFYALDVLAGHTYTLELRGTGVCGSFALGSSVTFDAAGRVSNLLVQQDQGTTLNAREFTPPADGRAVIAVEGTCAYELAVQRSSADGLEHDELTFEPNNSPSTALKLDLDSDAKKASLVAAGTDPDDYFAVDVVAGETYTVDVVGTGACSAFGFGTDVTLLSALGPSQLLATVNQGTQRTAREFTPNASGLAIVQVSGGCAYELEVEKSTQAGLRHDLVFEPNNSATTAAALGLDEVANSLVVASSDPDDFYAVPVLAEHTYTLELIGRSGCASFGISGSLVLDAAAGRTSVLAASNQGTTRTAREFTANADGLAIVRVSGACAYEVAVLQSSSDHLVQDATSFEPNDSPSTGTPLELNRLVSSQLQTGEDPDDYYAVRVVADETYTLQLTGTGACGSFSISGAVSLSSAGVTTSLLASSNQGTTPTSRPFTPSFDGLAIIRISGSCSYEVQVIGP